MTLQKEIENNKQIQSFLKKLESGKATQQDVSNYAARLGECIGSILNREIYEGIKWEDLNDLAMPLFKEAHRLTIAAAKQVEIEDNKKNGIGIKPPDIEFPESKIHDLIWQIFERTKADGS